MPGFYPLCGNRLIRGKGLITENAWVECEQGHKYYICEANRAVKREFRYAWDRNGEPRYGVWGLKP